MREVVDGVDETEHDVRARETHDEVVAGLTQLRMPHDRSTQPVSHFSFPTSLYGYIESAEQSRTAEHF